MCGMHGARPTKLKASGLDSSGSQLMEDSRDHMSWQKAVGGREEEDDVSAPAKNPRGRRMGESQI